jgi:hypothetical protein
MATTLHKVSMVTHQTFFPPSEFLSPFTTSLLTSLCTQFNKIPTQFPYTNLMPTIPFSSLHNITPLSQTYSITSTSNNSGRSHFDTPLALAEQSPLGNAQPYHSNLTPVPSLLQPHLLAQDQLKLWIPLESHSPRDTNGNLLPITDEDLERKLTVIHLSWHSGTQESYGSGLLQVYHVQYFVTQRPYQKHNVVQQIP